MDAKELQRRLNEVVANKVRHMIESHQPRVTETMQRLAHEYEIAQDFLVPIGNIANSSSRMGFYGDERIQIYIPNQGAFNLHNNALSQLGETMGLPPRRSTRSRSAFRHSRTATLSSTWEPGSRRRITATGLWT